MFSVSESSDVRKWLIGLAFGLALVLGVVIIVSRPAAPSLASDEASSTTEGDYIVLAWNDLGMHCYNRDFQYLAVLPPYNTLWAQVIRVGAEPEVVTSGITLTYHFVDNSFSVGKSNFWEHDQDLFGVDLAPNVGLTGKGMTGTLDLHGTHFVAEGIPLTEFRDSDYAANPTNPAPYPYQLAVVTVWDAVTGAKLAETATVAPVSTEMHCDNCHYDGAIDNIATGSVELNILTLHDRENLSDYPPGKSGPLVNRPPILCAECHASNALGAPGEPGIPNLSNAIHEKHDEEIDQTLDGCYQCHPGPQTKCLRDVMSESPSVMDCIDCHGDMAQVAVNPNPWLNEPRCDDPGCHDSGAYDQDQPLFRMSQEHGGIYCEGCHDSTHAIAPSREPNDAIKFLALQGVNKAIGADDHCTVCHSTTPADPGPHGISVPLRTFTFTPDRASVQSPGSTVVYTHTLQNTGNVSDTYGVAWTSSQEWADVIIKVGAATVSLPVQLDAGEAAEVEVTVRVPLAGVTGGMRDTTIVTVTSLMAPALFASVTDVTTTPVYFIYLPMVLR